MSKKLNEEALQSELKASAFFMRSDSPQEELSPTPPAELKPEVVEKKITSKQPTKAVSEPKPKGAEKTKHEPVPKDQSLDQSIDQSINRSIDKVSVDSSPIMGKPRGFYITEKQNQDLDIAVLEIAKRLGGKLLFKVDRSVLIRLIIEQAQLTEKGNIDKLAAKLISRSIGQLTG